MNKNTVRKLVEMSIILTSVTFLCSLIWLLAGFIDNVYLIAGIIIIELFAVSIVAAAVSNELDDWVEKATVTPDVNYSLTAAKQIQKLRPARLNIYNKSLTTEIKKIILEEELDCSVEDFEKIVDWDYISAEQNLSENFIREFQDKVDWYLISGHQKLSENFIREFQNKVDWLIISQDQKLSENLIREFQDRVDWSNISEYQKLSENFIREFQDKVDWFYILRYQKLSENFIREFQNKVDWKCISAYQKLSEAFIREFQDRVDWLDISAYQKLSEAFIREFQNKVDWLVISQYQKLSEDFIREFQNKVDWYDISKYQKLSEDFIREFQDKVSWSDISINQKLSKGFIKEFQDNVDVVLHYSKHKPKAKKKKLREIKAYAKKHGLKFDGRCLHAFRNHDKYGCGMFYKNIYYKFGEYYRDWHCDMDQNAVTSFGLGIYPKGNTKVLVSVGDWGVAVKSSVQGKARVWGFTVVGDSIGD